MSLLTTASASNRVVETTLDVSYSVRRITGAWTKVDLNVTTTYTSAYEYMRTATKTYRYIGMTQEAAEAKAAALRTLYTRATKVSEWDSEDGDFDEKDGGLIKMADVSAQLTDGDAYDVVVSVHEQDSRIRLSGLLTPSTLFTTENGRTYDE